VAKTFFDTLHFIQEISNVFCEFIRKHISFHSYLMKKWSRKNIRPLMELRNYEPLLVAWSGKGLLDY